MKKFLSLLIFLIIFFPSITNAYAYIIVQNSNSTITLTNVSPPQSWIKYVKQDQITWNDFNGLVPNQPEHDAYTTTHIKFDFTLELLDGGNCEFVVAKDSIRSSSYFDRDHSWVKPDKKEPGLLKHEQGHFDNAEIYARRLDNEIQKLVGSPMLCKGVSLEEKKKSMMDLGGQTIDKISNSIFLSRNFTDHLYDNEVKNNQNTQKRWNLIFESMLADRRISLAETRMIVSEEPKTIIIDNSQPTCPVLEIRDDCKLSNSNQIIFDVAVSLLIGLILAGYFYVMEKNDRKKIDIIVEQLGVTRDRRTNYAYNRIHSSLIGLEDTLTKINNSIHKYDGKSVDEIEKIENQEYSYYQADLFGDLDSFDRDKDKHISDLEIITNLLNDAIDPSHIEKISEICKLAKPRKCILSRLDETLGYEVYNMDLDVKFDDVLQLIHQLRQEIPNPQN